MKWERVSELHTKFGEANEITRLAMCKLVSNVRQTKNVVTDQKQDK